MRVTLLDEIDALIVRHAAGARRRLVMDGVAVGVAPARPSRSPAWRRRRSPS